MGSRKRHVPHAKDLRRHRPMTEESAAEQRALAEHPDSEIDLRDASELDAEDRKNAVQDDIKRCDLIRHFNQQRS